MPVAGLWDPRPSLLEVAEVEPLLTVLPPEVTWVSARQMAAASFPPKA